MKNICERLLLYFHYNSHHHFHYHHFHCHQYHCKMHLCRQRILPTILLDCLLQLNFVFFLAVYIILQSYSKFFTPSKKTQNSLTTNRQNLDVFFILIFISIVIYTSLFTLNCLYLFTIIYTYVLFILLFWSVSLQLPRKAIIPYCDQMFIETGFREAWGFKRVL